MNVLSEKKLCAFLERVLKLSNEVLERLPVEGTQRSSDALLDNYHVLVNDLGAERGQDSYLSDESWNWIWEDKPTTNHIQLYGRLAWINLQLLELL
ncbi:MAG: hypothetical protein V3T77_05215 [Planctomycetota bacterium]